MTICDPSIFLVLAVRNLSLIGDVVYRQVHGGCFLDGSWLNRERDEAWSGATVEGVAGKGKRERELGLGVR